MGQLGAQRPKRQSIAGGLNLRTYILSTSFDREDHLPHTSVPTTWQAADTSSHKVLVGGISWNRPLLIHAVHSHARLRVKPRPLSRITSSRFQGFQAQ